MSFNAIWFLSVVVHGYKKAALVERFLCGIARAYLRTLWLNGVGYFYTLPGTLITDQ